MEKIIVIIIILFTAFACEQPKPGGGGSGSGSTTTDVRDDVQNDVKDGMKQDFVVYGDKATKNSTNPQKFDFPTYFKSNASEFLNPVGAYNPGYKAADGRTYWYAVERTFSGQRIVVWGVVGQKKKNRFDW